jgi:hypothetical protein
MKIAEYRTARFKSWPAMSAFRGKFYYSGDTLLPLCWEETEPMLRRMFCFPKCAQLQELRLVVHTEKVPGGAKIDLDTRRHGCISFRGCPTLWEQRLFPLWSDLFYRRALNRCWVALYYRCEDKSFKKAKLRGFWARLGF